MIDYLPKGWSTVGGQDQDLTLSCKWPSSRSICTTTILVEGTGTGAKLARLPRQSHSRKEAFASAPAPATATATRTAYHIDPKPNPGTNGGISQSLPSSGPGLGSASFLRLVSRCSRQPDGVRDFSLYGFKRLACLVV